MMAEYPGGTHLAQSRKSPGGSSPLAYGNDGNGLVTQAVLFPADKMIEEAAAKGLTKGLAVGIAVGGMLTVLVVTAVLYVKRRRDGLASEPDLRPEDTGEAGPEGYDAAGDSPSEIRYSRV